MSSLQVFPIGTFGAAAARYLSDYSLGDLYIRQPLSAEIPGAVPDIYIVIAGRPAPHVCDRIDDLCHTTDRRFIPVVLDRFNLCLGPVVLPHCGSCWRCWLRRSQQHDPLWQQKEAIAQFYGEHANAEPKGYLEPIAMIAAARIAHTIKALRGGKSLGGHVWQLNVATLEISSGIAIGVHNCNRCGLNRPSGLRSVALLEKELRHLWRSEDGKR